VTNRIAESWTLTQGPILLGVIHVTDGDFPWLSGTWTPTPEFASVEPLFRAELELLNTLDDNIDEYDEAYEKIRAATTLHHPDGRAVADFLLHIDADQAWFRWSDEPDSPEES
jgi:hypothetical protein